MGKTYLTIGQDLFSIQEYIQSQYNASLHRSIMKNQNNHTATTTTTTISQDYFIPSATMSYTDIHQLRGLDEPADYGSGIEYIQGKQ
jgi:hypothetical protein